MSDEVAIPDGTYRCERHGLTLIVDGNHHRLEILPVRGGNNTPALCGLIQVQRIEDGKAVGRHGQTCALKGA